MEQIIGKKIYNTKTAIQIAEYDNGLNGTDFNALEEILYITKKNQFFLCYWGGAATHYAEHNGNYSSENSGITLFSPEQAYKWLEKNKEIEAIKKYFSNDIKEG